MRSSCISLSLTNGIAAAPLNRPGRLNCFSRVMHAERREALAADLAPMPAQSHDSKDGGAAFPAKRKQVFEGR